jgi:hypothetical protein
MGHPDRARCEAAGFVEQPLQRPGVVAAAAAVGLGGLDMLGLMPLLQVEDGMVGSSPCFGLCSTVDMAFSVVPNQQKQNVGG